MSPDLEAPRISDIVRLLDVRLSHFLLAVVAVATLISCSGSSDELSRPATSPTPQTSPGAVNCPAELTHFKVSLDRYATALRDLDAAKTVAETEAPLRSLLDTAEAIATAKYRTTDLETQRSDFSATLNDMMSIYRSAATGGGSNAQRTRLFQDVQHNYGIYQYVRRFTCATDPP